MARRTGPSPSVAATWKDRVARQSASGLSVAAFCQRERIHPVTFYSWRQRLAGGARRGRRTPKSQAFLPIELVAEGITPAGAGSMCELVVGTLVCRVPRGLDDESLRRWLRLCREEAARC